MLRYRRNATRAPRSCEPERLEGDHHFSGSERNLGGELSGERFLISMGYAARSGEKFSSRFCPGVRSATTPAVEAMRKRRIVLEASLTELLIFCNNLSP